MAARAENPGVVVVPDPTAYRQVVAISDVHGEFAHAETLLRAAGVLDAADHWAAGRTLMVVTGDSMDKGPQSVEVLRLWMRLQPEAVAKGGRLIVLLGNHEAEFLADPTGDKKAKETFADADSLHVPEADLSDPAKPLGKFLRGLPLAARVGDWLFCHAGWVPNESWPAFVAQAKATLSAGTYGDPLLAADDSILEKKSGGGEKKWWRSPGEIRELERRLDADGLAGVVFGHQPGGLDIVDNVGETADGRIFKIDSGMAPPSGGGSGDGAGQPYAGHLLIFTTPRELIGRHAESDHAGPHAIDVDSAGHHSTVPIAAAKG
jgi:hypothetical protein